MPASILIISNGPLCRNPRVLKEASCLGAAGFQVTVLTVRDHVPSEVQDAIIMQTAPFKRETIDVIPGYSAGSALIFVRRLKLWLARKAVASFVHLQTPEALGPAGALLRKAKALPAALTIVHNEVPHWVGTRLLKSGRKVAADIEDWHSEDLLPEDRLTRPIELIRRVERRLLREAVYTTTTSRALAEALHARYGGNMPQVIANSFPLQSEVSRSDRREVPAFFWFSQTLGRGRGIEQFLAAWRETSHPSRVVLLGTSHGSFQEELVASLPSGKRELVSFRPLVSPADLPAVIAEHDIGLALEDSAIVNRNLTITNKILQYLNAGLAVVASETAGQKEVLSNGAGAGILVDLRDTPNFTARLDELLADRASLALAKEKARALAVERYNWDQDAQRLTGLVTSSVPNP